MKPVEILRYKSRICKCGYSLMVFQNEKQQYRIDCISRKYKFKGYDEKDLHEQPSAWADSADDAWTVFEAAEILRA